MDPKLSALEAAAVQSLLKDGYVRLDDKDVGEYIEAMQKKGFQNLSLLSPYGREYYKEHVLDHPHIFTIIGSLLNKSKLGHWLRYKELPGHIECFRRGGQEAGLRVLIIQQWAKGSRADYYPGSHVLDLPTKEGERALYETTKDALHEAGCLAKEEQFPEGGLVIRDARLYVEMPSRYGFHLLFAEDEILAAYPKLIVPNQPELVRKIEELQTSKIRINFELKDSATS